MKNKTLIIITAAIITLTATLLTTGLALVYSSAVGETPDISDISTPSAESENAQPSDSGKPELPAEKTDESLTNEEIWEHNEQFVSDPGNFGELIVEVLQERDITVDIYEQTTGKLVGRVEITDDKLHDEFRELFAENFDHADVCFEPSNENRIPVCLPESEYRIEVYAVETMVSYGDVIGSESVLAISYSYESGEAMWEYTQTGLTVFGGETVIAFIDELIAEEMAKVKSGTAVAPETPMSETVNFERCWEKNIDGIDRYTPRFPYLAE